MKNKLVRVIIIVLALVLIGGSAVSCSSSIAGKWQDTGDGSNLEFSENGNVIYDDGNNIMTGTYELLSDSYVKVKFEGLAGAFVTLFGADTWEYEVSGDTLTLKAGDETTTFKRVR